MEEDIVRFFAVLDENNIVINVIAVPTTNKINIETGIEEEYTPEDMISLYPEGYKLQEYSIYNANITKNSSSVGYTYVQSLNAFIPPQPDETYILDLDDFVWYPNPKIEYNLNGDGVMSKWISETNSWKIVE